MADSTGRATKSLQSRQLRRSLSLSLAFRWAAFTAVYVVALLLLNVTLVPYVADRIADSTSEWKTWEYADYPLERCLEINNEQLAGLFDSAKAAEAGAYHLNELAFGDGNPDGDVVVGLREVQAMGYVEADEPAGNEVVYDDGFIAAVDMGAGYGEQELLQAVKEAEAAFDASGKDPSLAPYIVVRYDGGEFFATTPQAVREQAVKHEVLVSGGIDPADWQFSYGDDHLSARDLSFYNVVKHFKLPVAIVLYLIGCIVLIFGGYGRAMGYFDELSNAVGGIISDKEKPVELSGALALTQNELNSIRVASLADERAAKYAERRKDELVAYLAHDVKTPLTSVIGYLMLLEETPDMPAEQRQRYIGTAAEKAQRLEMLMDEFFEITRYNLQAIPIERAHVDGRLLMEQVAEEFYPEAAARGISIEVDAPEDAEMYVDADKFARALGNVVRNAVAYAEGGTSVKLAASFDEGTWTVQVENRGREISEAHLKSIFEKFYREDASRGSSTGGAGLGLAIAKEIVVAHNGDIEARSDDGVTTFTIKLPA